MELDPKWKFPKIFNFGQIDARQLCRKCEQNGLGKGYPMKLCYFPLAVQKIYKKNCKKIYTCAASRNTTERIMVIRAKHTTIV